MRCHFPALITCGILQSEEGKAAFWNHMNAYVEWINSSGGKEEILAHLRQGMKAFLPNDTIEQPWEIKELYQRIEVDFRIRAIRRARPGPEVPKETRKEWEPPGFVYDTAPEEKHVELAKYAGCFLARALASYIMRPDYPLPFTQVPEHWRNTTEIASVWTR